MYLRPLALALTIGLALAGCSKKEDRWSEAEKTAATAAAPTVAKPETGSFNGFFPPDGTEGLKRVFRADKPGYAEAVYGDETLVISITVADADAKKKFETATEKLQNVPLTTFGKNQTIAFAGGKYQVKAVSKTLDDAARRKWLERMNLTAIGSVPMP